MRAGLIEDMQSDVMYHHRNTRKIHEQQQQKVYISVYGCLIIVYSIVLYSVVTMHGIFNFVIDICLY